MLEMLGNYSYSHHQGGIFYRETQEYKASMGVTTTEEEEEEERFSGSEEEEEEEEEDEEDEEEFGVHDVIWGDAIRSTRTCGLSVFYDITDGA